MYKINNLLHSKNETIIVNGMRIIHAILMYNIRIWCTYKNLFFLLKLCILSTMIPGLEPPPI